MLPILKKVPGLSKMVCYGCGGVTGVLREAANLQAVEVLSLQSADVT